MKKSDKGLRLRGVGDKRILTTAWDQGGSIIPDMGQPLASGSTTALTVNPTIRRSGHLMDLSLQTKYKRKPTLFDQLSEDIQDRILEVESREWAEVGVKLSPTETKIVDSLCVLLHRKSQTEDPGSADYFKGNQGADSVAIQGLGSVPAPKLSFTLYELTKEYSGGLGVISGKDMDNVKSALIALDERRHLMIYEEKTYKQGGGYSIKRVEGYSPLISIIKISQEEYSANDQQLSREREVIIRMHPIFIRQIDSKFIKVPEDLLKRTVIAYGGDKISEAALKLRDYLIRAHSYKVQQRAKDWSSVIELERLYHTIAEKYMGEKRKKKVRDFTDKALKTAKALGILDSWEMYENEKTGEPMIKFYLNRDWN